MNIRIAIVRDCLGRDREVEQIAFVPEGFILTPQLQPGDTYVSYQESNSWVRPIDFTDPKDVESAFAALRAARNLPSLSPEEQVDFQRKLA